MPALAIKNIAAQKTISTMNINNIKAKNIKSNGKEIITLIALKNLVINGAYIKGMNNQLILFPNWFCLIRFNAK